jgi:hypothetical protein
MSPDFRALFAFCDLHASRVQRSWDDLIRLPDLGRDLVWPRYFDRQGFPIPGNGDDDDDSTTLAWARLREDRDYSIVAVDQLPDGSRLSTVWLGLDHNVFGGRPLIFETMRFSGESEEMTIVGSGGVEHRSRYSPSMEFPVPGAPGETTTQLRYGSEEEALAAHHEITRLLRKRWLV